MVPKLRNNVERKPIPNFNKSKLATATVDLWDSAFVLVKEVFFVVCDNFGLLFFFKSFFKPFNNAAL